MRHRDLTRRAILGGLGLAGGAVVLDGFLGLPFAAADEGECTPPNEAPLLVVCEFVSGWDTLLCLDPRNHHEYGEPGGAIYTAYERLTDPLTIALMDETGGTGLYQPPGSNVAFGPAMSKKLVQNHMDDLCVVRGVDMGTVTHEVGRRYFLTGKFPRGLAASGSSLETAWAAVSGHLDDFEIPSLVTGGAETYNENFSPLASGLAVPGYAEMLQVLRPLNASLALDGTVNQAAAQFHHGEFCMHTGYDGRGNIAAQRAAWSTAQALTGGGLWKSFDFKGNPPVGSQLDKLYDAFGVNKGNPAATLSNTPRGQAALAAQALTNRVSQVVMMQLVNVTDAHFDDDWVGNHPRRIRDGFDAVSELITLLKSTEDKPGKSFWDRTTLLCFSDFARTPAINAQGGRDHHLASACLVAGQGIKGNQAIGANKDTTYDARYCNLDTGAPDDEMGSQVRPPDVHATLLEAAGLCHNHISNQDPKLIKAMLKNG
ncbi:MAG: DUF1501 domain-containing protein [Myxococcales bacterium]|nr:DUF1501 domain-containing protein [Myxococcales bacterium]